MHDGFAGALPSMAMFVIGAVYIARLTRLLSGGSRLAGLVAAAIFVTNPSLLYLQTTAMSESDMIALLVVTVYYITLWLWRQDPWPLVLCAAAAAAGTLVRYDAWAMLPPLMITVAVRAWQRGGRVRAQAYVVLFASLTMAGCVLWLLYNQVVYGSAMAFATGSYSASYQQQRIQDTAGLPTHHDWLLSLQVYALDVRDTVGLPLMILAGAGLLYWILRSRFAVSTWPAFTLLTPFGFNWLSLILGISVIEVPEIVLIPQYGHTYFNVRYATPMIPAVAVFAALLVTAIPRKRKLSIAVSAALLAVTVVGFVSGAVLSVPYALADPLIGIGAPGHQDSVEGGKWIANHCQSGTILISYSPNGPMMFYSNLPLTRFITDADGSLFHQATANPAKYVEWVIFDTGGGAYNPVYAALGPRQDWRTQYVLRYQVATTQFYQRIGGASISPHATANASLPGSDEGGGTNGPNAYTGNSLLVDVVSEGTER